jgi:hypothetical protein
MSLWSIVEEGSIKPGLQFDEVRGRSSHGVKGRKLAVYRVFLRVFGRFWAFFWVPKRRQSKCNQQLNTQKRAIGAFFSLYGCMAV